VKIELKTRERAIFRTDVSEIQNKMFPPSLNIEKRIPKDLQSQRTSTVWFVKLRKPISVLSKFRKYVQRPLQRTVANSHYLKLEYSTSKISSQIKGEDNEDAAA
jgi:hypothetical protein